MYVLLIKKAKSLKLHYSSYLLASTPKFKIVFLSVVLGRRGVQRGAGGNQGSSPSHHLREGRQKNSHCNAWHGNSCCDPGFPRKELYCYASASYLIALDTHAYINVLMKTDPKKDKPNLFIPHNQHTSP